MITTIEKEYDQIESLIQDKGKIIKSLNSKE